MSILKALTLFPLGALASTRDTNEKNMTVPFCSTVGQKRMSFAKSHVTVQAPGLTLLGVHAMRGRFRSAMN